MRRRLPPILAAALLQAATARAEPCPVMPDRDAVPEFRADHAGRAVFFCCEECRAKFSEDPTPYLARLPKPAAKPAVSVADAAADWLVSGGGEMLAPYLAGAAGLGALALSWRIRRRVPGWAWGWLAAAGVAAGMGVGWHRAADESRRPRPPVVVRSPARQPGEFLKWAWPHGFAALPKGVRNTYYRGNDERDDKLFNGGRYLTATFEVGLVDGEGRPVSPGDVCAGRTLAVQLDVRRAPNTADIFFRPETTSRLFGARADRVTGDGFRAEVLEPNRHWRLRFPLETVPEQGELRGVGAVGIGDPDLFDPAAIVHYTVIWAAHFEGGRLVEPSTVWMVPVYLSPQLSDARVDAEWFSDRPIPVNERPSTDPRLLGVGK